MNEFIPILHFYRIVRLWWVVVLTMLLGSLMGYIVHRINPPVYEATASIFVGIDFDKVDGSPLTQYDEDLALSIVYDVFFTPEVRTAMVNSREYQSSGLDIYEWSRAIRVEREHAFWKVRARLTNPEYAQLLVNKWTELGYLHLQSLRETGEIPDYIMLEPPIPAELPHTPKNFGLNQLLLVGGLIGLILGTILSDWLMLRGTRSRKKVGD
jgi:hypothetical protein